VKGFRSSCPPFQGLAWRKAVPVWLAFRSPDVPFANHAAGAVRAKGRLSLADRGLQPPPRLRPGNGGRLRGRGKTRPAPRIFAESAGSGAVAGSGPQNVVWFRTIAKTAVRHTRTTPVQNYRFT